MLRPLVVNEADGLQAWRVAVKMSNKRSRTVDEGRSYLGVGRGVCKSLSEKQTSILCNVIRGLRHVLALPRMW
jgi:hypothetical protein